MKTKDEDQPLRSLLAGAVDRWRMNRRVCPHHSLKEEEPLRLPAYECEICLVDHILATLKKLRYRLERS